MTEKTTRITQIGTVGIPVADHDKALEFYVGTLGFEVRIDGEFAPGQRWVEVAPAGAASTIALAPAHPGSPAGVDTGIRLSTPNAEADHAHLLASGADVDAEIMRWGDGVPPMFTLRDPDGNTLYVVERA
jgi:catechol 2,3-dioxygenase-like lactoylglutathione lyase family enzyme